MRLSVLLLAVFFTTIPLVAGGRKDFGYEDLRVKGVTSTTVVLQWLLDKKGNSESKVTCIGKPSYDVAVDLDDIHEVIQYAPQCVKRLMIGGLEPSYKYTCVRMKGGGFNSWGDMSLPATFATHAHQKAVTDVVHAQTTPVSQAPETVVNEAPETVVNEAPETIENEAPETIENGTAMSFRASYGEKMARIILGGLLPMLLVVGCIAACILYKKCSTYKIRRGHYKKMKDQRIAPVAFPGGTLFDKNLQKQTFRKKYDSGKEWMMDMEAGLLEPNLGFKAAPGPLQNPPLKQYPLTEAVSTEEESEPESPRVLFNRSAFPDEIEMDFDENLRFMQRSDGFDPWLDKPRDVLESERSPQLSFESSSVDEAESDSSSESGDSDSTVPLYLHKGDTPLPSDESDEILFHQLLAARRGMRGGIGAHGGIPAPLSMVVIVNQQLAGASMRSLPVQKRHSDVNFTLLN